MKLLILTAWYHPFIHPRAHRWTALAEHWADKGFEVRVLTARVGKIDRETVLNGVRIHRTGFDSLKEWLYFILKIQQGRGRVGALPGRGGRVMQLLEWLYKKTWKNLFFPDDACVWYFPAKRKLFQLLENESFDALITVSLPFTGHLLGLAAKRRFPAIHWIADIGDPFSIQAQSPNNTWLYGRKNLCLEREVLETADAVSVTTEATVKEYQALFGGEIARKIWVIPPLFTLHAGLNDPKEAGAAIRQTAESRQTKAVSLGYFGALYAKTRTPDTLLDLLTRIFSIRSNLKARLEFHFYGEIFPEFYEALSSQPAIQLHGLRSRSESWLAMQSMDVLINIGNTSDFQLPSKAVDYLASGKPVLNLSYVEADPFARFFEGNPMIFNLPVRHGKISEADVLRCIQWLESEKTGIDPEILAEKLKPFQVESIAAQYEALITKVRE